MSDLRDEARAAGLAAALAAPVQVMFEGRVEAAVDAVLDMLAPVEDHIVDLGEARYTVTHPLTERAAGTMHECNLHAWLGDQGGPPAPPGRYIARRPEHDPYSSSFRSDAPLWELEPLPPV